MRWYLKRRGSKVVHSAVKEGGGKIEIMMTACGLSIRWDQPHDRWQRAQWTPANGEFHSHLTCKRCLP